MSASDEDQVFDGLSQIGFILWEQGRLLKSKPLLGGVFGSDERYWLSSRVDHSQSLWAVQYYVLEASSGFPLSIGDTKDGVIRSARKLLELYPERIAASVKSLIEREREAVAEAEAERQRVLSDREALRESAKVKSIPKRRQRIFDESEGKCHYCGTVLTLDGKWHIEHKMPKALMGGNEPGNLVASCVTCNHRKKDKTDIEFKAQLAREA